LPRDGPLLIAPGKLDTFAGFWALSGSTINFYTLALSVIPRVYIDSHPVGQSVHRLAKLDGFLITLEHNFPVLSVPMSHWPLMRSKISLRDLNTLEVVDSFAFEHGEQREGRFAEIGWCCAVGELQGLDGAVLVVGTCIASDDAKTETGRLLVFQLAEGRKLSLISANEIGIGGVKAISIVRGAVLAAIRGSNVLFKWDYARERRLVKASSSGGHIEGTAFDVQENIVATGDALTSVAFCSVNAQGGKITEFARDFQDNYITSVQLVDFSAALAADLTGNLLLLQVIRDESLNLNAAVIKGNIHVADMINTIRRADFLSRPKSAKQSFLAASAGGALYSLHQLGPDTCSPLLQLQKNLSAQLNSIGGIKHGEFRRFFNGERTFERSAGFIDGDLLSRFLSFAPGKQTEVMGLLSKSTLPEKITEISKENLCSLIESLSYGL
jgi:DNA damage-binding protein 1